MGAKLYNAVELIKLWRHAHYGDHVTHIGYSDGQANFSQKTFLEP